MDATPDGPILTPRLSLELLRLETLAALEAHDIDRASERQGLRLPADFVGADGLDDFFLRVQQQRQRAHPDELRWCARVMVQVDDGAAVGHCGFHGPPHAVGRAEIGYSVLPPYRGRGLATEAAGALVEWAFAQGQRTVFASVSPDNAPSLAVVRKLGFEQTGVQIDDIDGKELVFELSQP